MSNKEVIKEFLTKMATQDNRMTAAPYFYVIRTEVETYAPLDNCDVVMYVDPEYYEHSYENKQTARISLTKDGYDKDEVEEIVNRLEEYGLKRHWEKRHMFLTENDANRHLKLNSYHYSANAHTYVEHAWRAPELEGFFKALFKEYKVDVGNLDLRMDK